MTGRSALNGVEHPAASRQGKEHRNGKTKVSELSERKHVGNVRPRPLSEVVNGQGYVGNAGRGPDTRRVTLSTALPDPERWDDDPGFQRQV